MDTNYFDNKSDVDYASGTINPHHVNDTVEIHHADEETRDESMMSLADMVEDMVQPFAETEDDKMAVSLVGIGIDMPVQLQVTVVENGKVVLGITPPLYKVDTSFATVYHQIGFTCELDQ